MYLNTLAFTLLVMCSAVALGISGSGSEKTEESLYDMRIQIEALTSEMTQLRQLVLEYHGKCDVEYGDSCFFGIFVNPDEVNQNAAKLLCEKKGAQPGNIYSSDHYNQIMSYLRPWIGSLLDDGYSVGIRTGMTVEPQSQIVYLFDNSRAGYVNWAPSYPMTSSTSTTLILRVYPEGHAANGMGNNDPADAKFGVLSEIKL